MFQLAIPFAGVLLPKSVNSLAKLGVTDYTELPDAKQLLSGISLVQYDPPVNDGESEPGNEQRPGNSNLPGMSKLVSLLLAPSLARYWLAADDLPICRHHRRIVFRLRREPSLSPIATRCWRTLFPTVRAVKTGWAIAMTKLSLARAAKRLTASPVCGQSESFQP